VIWVISLGSNTAGGIFAPLLMIGAAMGLAMGHWMTPISPGAWAVVGMTAVVSAALGAPLTAAMFAVELTHNGGLMLPVLLACVVAYGISVLVQPRSMITEGLSRKGLHLSREYGIDPLEMMFVAQAMHTSVFALPGNATCRDAKDWLDAMNSRGPGAWSHWQRLFPLVDAEGRLTAVLTRSQMMQAAKLEDLERSLALEGNADAQSVDATETLRQVATTMAESKLTAYPVVNDNGQLKGIITIEDLLVGRTREAQREGERVRVLNVRWPFGQTKPEVRAVAATVTGPAQVPSEAEVAKDEEMLANDAE